MIGTHHFTSIARACKYHEPYGYDKEDVLLKLKEGEIAIGPPVMGAGESMTINDEGRYVIVRHE